MLQIQIQDPPPVTLTSSKAPGWQQALSTKIDQTDLHLNVSTVLSWTEQVGTRIKVGRQASTLLRQACASGTSPTSTCSAAKVRAHAGIAPLSAVANSAKHSVMKSVAQFLPSAQSIHTCAHCLTWFQIHLNVFRSEVISPRNFILSHLKLSQKWPK